MVAVEEIMELIKIVGADKIGMEYVFVKGNGSNGWENVLIVANEVDDTRYLSGWGSISCICKFS